MKNHPAHSSHLAHNTNGMASQQYMVKNRWNHAVGQMFIQYYIPH